MHMHLGHFSLTLDTSPYPRSSYIFIQHCNSKATTDDPCVYATLSKHVRRPPAIPVSTALGERSQSTDLTPITTYSVYKIA